MQFLLGAANLMTTTQTKIPRKAAFAVAGSDPSGGAGIQADLKTFTSIGVYGAGAITCLTAQNTLGVASCLPMNPAFFRKQIQLVLDDMPVSHIKIGMVGSPEIAGELSSLLRTFQGEIIYDPVMRASDGHALFNQDDPTSSLTQVVKLATVLTPNLDEVKRLSNMACGDRKSVFTAVKKIFAQFPKLRSIIVKGGHIDEAADTVTDHLITRPFTITASSHPRIKTINTHGTGCTFASAFTAFHLLYRDDIKAFQQTVAYIDHLLEKSAGWKMGQGNGPLIHHLGGCRRRPEQDSHCAALINTSSAHDHNPDRSRSGHY